MHAAGYLVMEIRLTLLRTNERTNEWIVSYRSKYIIASYYEFHTTVLSDVLSHSNAVVRRTLFDFRYMTEHWRLFLALKQRFQ